MMDWILNNRYKFTLLCAICIGAITGYQLAELANAGLFHPLSFLG